MNRSTWFKTCSTSDTKILILNLLQNCFRERKGKKFILIVLQIIKLKLFEILRKIVWFELNFYEEMSSWVNLLSDWAWRHGPDVHYIIMSFYAERFLSNIKFKLSNPFL